VLPSKWSAGVERTDTRYHYADDDGAFTSIDLLISSLRLLRLVQKQNPRPHPPANKIKITTATMIAESPLLSSWPSLMDN
jgi:hypothetical protein